MAKWVEVERLGDNEKLLINTRRLLAIKDNEDGSILRLNEGTILKVTTPYEEWKKILQKEEKNGGIKFPNLHKHRSNPNRILRFMDRRNKGKN